MERITSLQNAKVKKWASLHQKKERDKTGTFLIEGEHLLQEAVRENVLEHNGIRIDHGKHEVTVNGKMIDLTLKEYEVLALLMSRPGIVFTRDQLLSKVWEEEYTTETRTVDVHIRTLRQKLQEEGAHIDTVRGVGYRYKEAL